MLIRFSKGLSFSVNQEGQSKIKFGCTIDLGGSPTVSGLGKLFVSKTELLKTVTEQIDHVKVSGIIENKKLPNLLLTIGFPEKPSQDFILLVGKNGRFGIDLKVDKNTSPGIYKITAKYASKVIGSQRFEIKKRTLVGSASEKTNSIVVSPEYHAYSQKQFQ